MKISIITAVYNRARAIGAAMMSLKSQSFENYEHIIQDGGSSDGTVDEIRRLSDHRTSLISEQDQGIYDAINKGIDRATGDVIGLLHSDDIWASDHVLQDVARYFDDQDVDGVYGDLNYVSDTHGAKIVRRWRAGSYTPRMISRGWMPPHPTLFLRSSVFDTWGRYDTGFRIAGDYEMILRLLVNGNVKLGYLPETLVSMTTGGISNRSLGAILRKMREDADAARRHGLSGTKIVVFKNFRKLGQFFV